MPDAKITALTAISVIDPAVDPLPIVDVSDTAMAASGTTKKITINQLLGASGTATLASATISGDLTVDTSTLKVDSANNRVGIVQATPLYPLDVTGTVNGTAVAARLAYGVGGSVYSAFRFENTSFSGGNSEIRNYVNGATGTGSDLAFFTTQTGGSTLTERYRLDVSGVATWSNVGGVAGTAMTLNSTGLGVGGSPVSGSKLTVVSGNILLSNAYYLSARNAANTLSINLIGRNASDEVIIDADGYGTKIGAGGAVQIPSSGNVGLGVTPSAWRSGARAFQSGANGYLTLWEQANGSANLGFGVYEGSSNAFNYKTTGDATTLYSQLSGAHKWFTAPSGTAGNAITFTERLRLKETGQLRFIPLAADPAGAEAGDVYYNSSSNKLKCYNGTTWNDLF